MTYLCVVRGADKTDLPMAIHFSCLVVAGFLDFYIDAAMTRPEAAWKDLFTMGYDRSLKRAVVRASMMVRST